MQEKTIKGKKKYGVFGARIRKIRKITGLTLNDFAISAGVTQDAVVRWENYRGGITLNSLNALINSYPEYTMYLVTGHLDYLGIQKMPAQYQSCETFKQLIDKYLEFYAVEFPATLYSQKLTLKIIAKYFGDNKIVKSISLQDIINFKTQRAKSVAVSTINRNLSVLSSLLNYYCEYIDSNWLPPRIKLLKNTRSVPPKFYTKDELRLIYNANQLLAHNWQFIVNTGLRVSEFYNLQWENVQENEITIISTEQHRNKSSKFRVIPLNQPAKNALSLFDKNQKYVAQRFASVDVYKKRFRRICYQVCLTDKSGIHCLRHTFASHLVQNDVPMRKIQKLLGHASITTTENYAHLINEGLHKEVSKINL